MLTYCILGAVLLVSLWYNWRQHLRLKSYEQVWNQIEQVADHNQDGTFTINVQHMEVVHPEEITEELHPDLSGRISIPVQPHKAA